MPVMLRQLAAVVAVVALGAMTTGPSAQVRLADESDRAAFRAAGADGLRLFRVTALLVSTVWFVALIALPWFDLVPWRPKLSPRSSIEFAFIAAKLSVAAILCAIGAALIRHEASRTPVAS